MKMTTSTTSTATTAVRFSASAPDIDPGATPLRARRRRTSAAAGLGLVAMIAAVLSAVPGGLAPVRAAQQQPAAASKTATAAVAAEAPAATAETAAEPTLTVELDPGWKWLVDLEQPWDGWSERGIDRLLPDSSVILVHWDRTNHIVVRHVWTKDVGKAGSAVPEYRFHLLDVDGNPLPRGGSSSMWNNDVRVDRYVFGPLEDPTRLARWGVAGLDYDGRRTLAEAASRRAAELGASVLPLPVVGEAYAFDLPAMSDPKARIRSADLKGKVVLIDCWATWCGPCMAKMPELKTVHAKYKDHGLVVVGVSFDHELERAEKTVQEQDLNWHHVFATGAAKGHDNFWSEITGIRAIPRLLLINRDGILVADDNPQKVLKELEKMFENVG